jgi:hypothetical protein
MPTRPSGELFDVLTICPGSNQLIAIPTVKT